MELNIDFSKPDELREKVRQFKMVIETAEAALRVIEQNGGAVRQVPLKRIVLPPTPAARVVETLPQTFTTRDARNAAVAMGVTEQRVMNEVMRQVKSRKITMKEKGHGPFPSSFEKVLTDPVTLADLLGEPASDGRR